MDNLLEISVAPRLVVLPAQLVSLLLVASGRGDRVLGFLGVIKVSGTVFCFKEFFAYYNERRAHQGLDGDAPASRNKEPPELGPVVATPVLGGLHHSYSRRAA
ncbi:hypothetical protein [Posidoniimonas polymericola]|uniref:hypothetical protein n=1 Tax=Posidoniimonas polymericola TaxID=2528002 RepID=UPI0018D2C99E|nr:hypothetical protein [Posidoniimonas polymericola]